MSQFKIGDVVRLKSGGPLMTITDIGADRMYCTWIADDGGVQDAWFPVMCIVPDKETLPN